jgi:hypothetical protein
MAARKLFQSGPGFTIKGFRGEENRGRYTNRRV